MHLLWNCGRLSPVGADCLKTRMWAVLLCTLSSQPLACTKNTDEKVACNFFSLNICLWLLSLNTLTWELCVLVQSRRRWLSYCKAMRHHFVTARSTTAKVSVVLPVCLHSDLYSISPPQTVESFPNDKWDKTWTSLGMTWSPITPCLPSALAISRWTRQKELIKRGADNTAAN